MNVNDKPDDLLTQFEKKYTELMTRIIFIEKKQTQKNQDVEELLNLR